VERKVLSEAFQEALQGWRLRAGVFLTFRFDPGFFQEDVLPVFFDIPLSHARVPRLLHVADALRTTGPIAVYYDRRALHEETGSARTDFQRIGLSHRTGYFHPKNVLLLVERSAPDSEEGTAAPSREQGLIVGCLSANLTRAGWWEQVEVAHIETVRMGESCGFRDDLLSLVALLRRISPEGADHSALEEIHGFVRGLEQEPQRLEGGLLIPRLFAGGRDLVDFLDELAGNRLRGRCLEVISPYFDDKESAQPIHRLIEKLKPRETRVFLPRGSVGEALCSERYWQRVRDAGAAWATLPREVVRLSRDTDRVVHAKVYRFFDPDDRRETFFVGSVNLTNAGFGRAGNVESGFLLEVEGPRKSEWWLEPQERRPASFVQESETEGVVAGPGANLVLRFNWETDAGTAVWDADTPSPPLLVRGGGVPLGEIGPLGPRQATLVGATFAARLKDHLLSSSFVTVAVEGEPDAVVLVDEEGGVDKPPLLATLSADEILRFWSLLTDAQKKEFFETHAGALDDDERALWIGGSPSLPFEAGIFGTFAHVYLSFGNLERAVRNALEERRHKEAVDRLFGRKFDSLRRLVERIREKEGPVTVQDYVALLCAIQVLEVLRKDLPDFYAAEKGRFELVHEARTAADAVKARLSLTDTTVDRDAFFGWFEEWFLRRATPPPETPAA